MVSICVFYLDAHIYEKKPILSIFYRCMLQTYKQISDSLKIVLHLRDRHIFIRRLLNILNIFITLTLKQFFWKTKTFFEKVGYRFLVNTMMESGTFLHKTTLSKAIVKTNRNTKWEYEMDLSQRAGFCHQLRFFLKFNISIKTSDKYFM